ncbi:major facilitator superfamily domain-containing protein 6-like [Amphiura filiformis]|uniref:major facilitator superfamily domain-containing protein 6-like n=1 Tax=Amphiura filiformis TaxID=82378 RepID=UPI003B212E62
MYFPEDDTLIIEHADIPEATDEEKEKDREEAKKGWCNGNVNPDLLICKAFYFLFYGAFGSLYPLLAVYFKQLGLSATQSGVLVGIRPFVEFCSAPMWGGIADTWHKARVMLLFSLASWLIFTEAIAFVKPAESTCVLVNQTSPHGSIILVPPSGQTVKINPKDYHVEHAEGAKPITPLKSVNVIPISTDSNNVTHQVNATYHQDKAPKSTVTIIEYLPEDIESIFLLLLLFVIVGEFFSSPTITLADSATLGYLGRHRMEYYGRQRMFGSLGWGIFMLVEGLILDKTQIAKTQCNGAVDRVEKNYLICFGTYAVLITCSFFVATQFQFKYSSDHEDATEMTKIKDAKEGKDAKSSYGSMKEEQKNGTDEGSEKEPPSVLKVLKMYATVRYGSVLFISWFAGFGVGLLFTFLYWHLEDLGGPPSLFGIAAVVNHTSEVIAYFFSHIVIMYLGYIPVLCLGLLAFAVRFLVISILVNPWWVLPTEAMQGATHALIWAASTSFIGQATSQEMRSSAQGILQGTYHGLGRGCGAIFGGLLVSAYGTVHTFRSIGITSLIVMFVFLIIQTKLNSIENNKKESNDTSSTAKADKEKKGKMKKKKKKGKDVGIIEEELQSQESVETDLDEEDTPS